MICPVMLRDGLFSSAMLVESAEGRTLGKLGGPGALAAAVCRVGGPGGLFLKSNNPNLSGGEKVRQGAEMVDMRRAEARMGGGKRGGRRRGRRKEGEERGAPLIQNEDQAPQDAWEHGGMVEPATRSDQPRCQSRNGSS